MRRSSVITIVLLILVIIGLVVALVATNLPQEESENTVLENNESVEYEQQQEENVEETPTSISLNSEIVQNMYNMINGRTGDIFHCLKKGKLTVEDLPNEYIQTIAYFYDASKYVERFDMIDD